MSRPRGRNRDEQEKAYEREKLPYFPMMRCGMSLGVCIKLSGLAWKNTLINSCLFHRPFAVFGRRGHSSNKPNINHEYEGHAITTSKPMRAQLCAARQYTQFQN